MRNEAIENNQSFSSKSAEIDVEELMREIREKTISDLQKGDAWSALRRKSAREVAKQVDSPLLYSDELNYINAHWHNWSTSSEITSHRPFIGPFIVKIKKFFLGTAWKYLLSDYMERERNFQMNLVRFLNASARYIDSRDSDIFWELIAKLDNDFSRLREEIEALRCLIERSAVTAGGDLRNEKQERLTQNLLVEGRIEQLESSADRLRELIIGLETALGVAFSKREESTREASYGFSSSEGANEPRIDCTHEAVDIQYLLLENRFRGSEETIKERQTVYLEFLGNLPGPVLELGCGRGELLDLLQSRNISARGLDLDPAMVERSKAKGLNVKEGNALTLLADEQDSSLGAVIALQFVEHLTLGELNFLIETVYRKLAPGGVVIFETIDPQSFAALARNFFRDPTHKWPIHPDTLNFALEMKGFQSWKTLNLAPYPDSVLLEEIPLGSHLPARWQHALTIMNQNFSKVNKLLFGFQDYAVIARVPLEKQ